ncbi:hypothetical protein niasHT_022104 [Heterodera trifolii]|uniref:Uncharacterized protein n=1 Tax=Heterodera trifolii TaxID=157864 RepID=A0ABD2KNN2_9BILA
MTSAIGQRLGDVIARERNSCLRLSSKLDRPEYPEFIVMNMAIVCIHCFLDHLDLLRNSRQHTFLETIELIKTSPSSNLAEFFLFQLGQKDLLHDDSAMRPSW